MAGEATEDAPEQRHVHRDMTFLIIGNHPHRGEHGHPVGKSPDTITHHQGVFFGEDGSYELELIDCEHGTRSCFAAKVNMKPVTTSDSPAAKTTRRRRRR